MLKSGTVLPYKGGFVTKPFMTLDKKWAFQRVGNDYNLYDKNGDFVKTFRSFKAMYEYIEEDE